MRTGSEDPSWSSLIRPALAAIHSQPTINNSTSANVNPELETCDYDPKAARD